MKVTDFDNDGDLDLVTVAVNGPAMAFLNNSQEGNAVAFASVIHSRGIGVEQVDAEAACWREAAAERAMPRRSSSSPSTTAVVPA